MRADVSADVLGRAAVKADLAAIQRIARQTWASTYAGVIPTDVQQQALAVWYSTDSLCYQLSDGNNMLLVAELEGIAIGFAQFFLRPERSAKLARIYVLPNQQGKGIGSQLLETGLEWLRGAGVRRLTVDVEELNPSGRRFYEHRGFQEIGTRQDDLFGLKLSTVSYELAVASAP
jgi:GNAT superfamily N-acetyltransferase